MFMKLNGRLSIYWDYIDFYPFFNRQFIMDQLKKGIIKRKEKFCHFNRKGIIISINPLTSRLTLPARQRDP